MKIAVKKEEGRIPGGGFHYMVMAGKLEAGQARAYEMMGFVILDVDPKVGEELLRDASAALLHQIRVAHLTEAALEKARG